MASFSKEDINKVKNNTDIVKLVANYTNLKRIGNNIWRGRCPFPERHADGDSDPSFTVHELEGSFYCYGCHAGEKEGDSLGSDVISFIRMKEGLSFTEAISFLANEAEVELSCMPDIEGKRKLLNNILENNRLFYLELHRNEDALDYLINRGITKDDILKWRIGLVPDNYSFKSIRGRIVFPILNRVGEVVAFGYRSINGEKPKYRNSSESSVFKKGEILYGLNYAISDVIKSRKVYITEGYTDVISAHKYGVCNTVGLMGIGLTDEHINLISKYADIVVLALDGDSAGYDNTCKYIDKIRNSGLIPKVIPMDTDMDIDKCAQIHKQDFNKWLDKNERSPDQWRIDRVISKYNSNVITLRHQVINECIEILEHISDPIEKASYIHSIADSIGIPAMRLISKEN